MGGIFPLRETVSLGEDRDPRLIELDEDVADEVFDALSSRTTRTIFAELHASPQTASDLAEVTDTSVQNAQYHLEKLVAADLVEVVDTWYSERGTEMKVYAPTDEALVLLAGEDTEGALRSLLKRVVGVLAVLLPGSAVVAILADRLTAPDSAQSFQSAGAGAGTETAETEEEAAPRESSEEGADSSGEELVADGDGADGGDDVAGGSGDSGGDGGGDSGMAETPDAEQMDAENATLRGNETNGTGSNETADTIATPEATEGAVDTATGTTPTGMTPTPDPEAADVAVAAAGGLDPALVAGLSFFFGGAFVLALLAVAWYWSVRG
jgi:DNA-binding transcriptional ArsR family regulator